MLVRNWMSRNVIAIDVKDSMAEATRLMKENKVRRLPVLKRGRLVGILTDRDIKEASASDANTLDIHELLYLLTKIRVEEIMTKDPVTVSPDYTVEETAQILLEKKISGVPVVDREGELAGIITQTDIFKVLVSLAGLSKRGISFGFMLDDKAGSIKEVADIIRRYGGRMASILSTYESAPEGQRRVYIRMYDVDRSRLSRLKEELKEKATLLYMVDHKENTREIYVEKYLEKAVLAAK